MEIKLLVVDLDIIGSGGYAVVNQDYEVLRTGRYRRNETNKQNEIQNQYYFSFRDVYNLTRELLHQERPTHVAYQLTDQLGWESSLPSKKIVNMGYSSIGTSFVLGCYSMMEVPHNLIFDIIQVGKIDRVYTETGYPAKVLLDNHFDDSPIHVYEKIKDTFGQISLCNSGLYVKLKSRQLTPYEVDALAVAKVAMDEIKKDSEQL